MLRFGQFNERVEQTAITTLSSKRTYLRPYLRSPRGVRARVKHEGNTDVENFLTVCEHFAKRAIEAIANADLSKRVKSFVVAM